MNLRFLRGASCAIVFAAGLILASSSLAQRPPGGGPPAGGRPTPGHNSDIFPTASLHVYVRGPAFSWMHIATPPTIRKSITCLASISRRPTIGGKQRDPGRKP